MTAAFGTPAPLPGQPGFRARPSDSMAQETTEMEERLSRLKADLAAEAEMRELAGPRKGGARWRSARVDRGSVRAYAKDVKIRHKKQLQLRPQHEIFATASGRAGLGGRKAQPQAGAGARAAAALRDEQQQRQQQHRKHQAHHQCTPPAAVRPSPDFTSKEVTRWGVGDTLEWLDSLELGEYGGVFQQNEISGRILLEVGLDDLDYMDIRVLAHRKRILKGIEDLRKGGGPPFDADIPPPPAPTLVPGPEESSGQYDDNDRNRPRGEGTGAATAARAISRQQRAEDRQRSDHRLQPLNGGRKKQHWSAIKPLSENQTERESSGELPPAVNLADGQYVQVAACFPFQDAVVEWRGEGDNSTATLTTAEIEARAPSLHRPAVVGRAPLAGMPIPTAVEHGREETRQLLNLKTTRIGLLGGGGGRRRGTGEGEECWTNPSSCPRSSKKEVVTRGESQLVDLALVDAGQQEAQKQDHILTPVFALDEEAEHEAFRKAVADWNRGQSSSVKPARDGSSSDGDARPRGSRTRDASSAATTAVDMALPVRRTTEAMAEELRKQMDAEHRLQAKELEERKRALLEGLQLSRDGKRKGGGRDLDVKSGGATFEPDARDDDASWSEEEINPTVPSSAASSIDSSVARSSCSGGRDAEEALSGFDLGDGDGVEIEMMESVLGADLSSESIEVGVSYIVDEGDSGDESCC